MLTHGYCFLMDYYARSADQMANFEQNEYNNITNDSAPSPRRKHYHSMPFHAIPCHHHDTRAHLVNMFKFIIVNMYTKGAASSALYFSNNRWDNTPRAIISRCHSLSLALEHARLLSLCSLSFRAHPINSRVKKGQQIIINAAYLSKISFHKFVVIFLNFSLWECTWNAEHGNRQKNGYIRLAARFVWCARLWAEVVRLWAWIMWIWAGFCSLCATKRSQNICHIEIDLLPGEQCCYRRRRRRINER